MPVKDFIIVSQTPFTWRSVLCTIIKTKGTVNETSVLLELYIIRTSISTQKVQRPQRSERSVENQEKQSNASHYTRQVQSFNEKIIIFFPCDRQDCWKTDRDHSLNIETWSCVLATIAQRYLAVMCKPTRKASSCFKVIVLTIYTD